MKAGLAVLLLIAVACLLAPAYARWVSGTEPFRTNILGTVRGEPVLAEAPGGLGTVPAGPGWRGAYLLGADGLGRDVAARLLYGGRTSLLVAVGATLLCLAVGGLAGTLSGAWGGWVDQGVSALIDLVWAFPVTLLAIALAAVLGGEQRGLWLPVVILGLVYSPYVARPVRAALLALRDTPFIEAATATGGGRLHILRRHLLPQLAPLLLGLAPVVAAMVMLTEAALSVLGLGVPAPGVSWGTLIGDGIALLHQRPVVAIAPGLALSATVLALNAVGEGFDARR
ncbi:MAG: ABC transporter permease [Janthinobacterium lividum]